MSALIGRERLGFLIVASGILLALAVACLSLRLYRLSEVPPALLPDESAHGIDALDVLQGKHSVFFSGNRGREGMIVYLIALTTSLLGRTVQAIRLPTALASSATVFVVLWLGSLLFSRDERTGKPTPWRGLFIGGVGAGLMAVSLSQTYLARIAFRTNLLPLFLSLCLAWLWIGWNRRDWRQTALAGLCAGLLPYTYSAALFTPLFLLAFGLSFLRPFGAVGWRDLRPDLPQTALFLGTAALVAGPILVYAFQNQSSFLLRSGDLWIFQQLRGQESALAALWQNLVEYLQPFGLRGSRYWDRNYVDSSILSPFEVPLLAVGLYLAIWRWKQSPTLRLLLLWLVTLSVPMMLARNLAATDFAEHIRRMNGATPAVYLLTAFGAWELVQFFRKRDYFQQGTTLAIAAVLATSGLILIQGILSFRIYFHQWASGSFLKSHFGLEWVELASTLNDLSAGEDDLYLVSSSYNQWRYTVGYLFRGETPVRLIDPESPNLAREVRAAFGQVGIPATAKMIEWNSDNFWIGDDNELLDFLLTKYGRYAHSQEFPKFRIHTYADLNFDQPWTFYEQLEPLPIQYDGGIALTGFALGQGPTQLPSHQQMVLERGDPLWGFLQWQTGAELDVDFALSLRLYNEKGSIAIQIDHLIWKLTNRSTTSHWSENEKVDSLFFLALPDGFRPGIYDLRLVVYDVETQVPTVETGVWRPETTLARLELSFPADP